MLCKQGVAGSSPATSTNYSILKNLPTPYFPCLHAVVKT